MPSDDSDPSPSLAECSFLAEECEWEWAGCEWDGDRPRATTTRPGLIGAREQNHRYIPDLRVISTQTKLHATLANNLENLLIAYTLLHYTAIRYPLSATYPLSIVP